MAHEDERSVGRGRTTSARRSREVLPAQPERPFQPLSYQELEVLYDLHAREKSYSALTDQEAQALQLLDEVRLRELNELIPPSFRIIILGKFSKDRSYQRYAEQELERARTFCREQVLLSDDERNERARRQKELQGTIYGLPLDSVRDQFDPERNAQTATFILQKRRELRTLTPEEDQEYIELVRKLESRELSVEEDARLDSLKKLGRGEDELLLGDRLDSFATDSRDVATEALRFFEEWDALSPRQQRTRYNRIMELNDRSIKITNLTEGGKREAEEKEKAQKVAAILATRSPRPGFERELFRDGVLEFETPAAFRRDHPSIGRMGVEWEVWLEHFKGKIPKRWGDHWGNVAADFEKAKAANVQLNTILVDAGVSHPHWHIVATVAKTQRLTPLQMAIALEAGDARNFREEILKGQRDMGTPEMDIKEAAYTFLLRGHFNLREIPFRGS